MATYRRALVDVLIRRMNEPRRFIQVVVGPRQTGKTTAITQALSSIRIPYLFVSADEAGFSSREWLRAQWEAARAQISTTNQAALLIVDEVQNITQWSTVVKALWDEDARSGVDLRVVLTGSSSLLLQSGLSESLMGRFELLRNPHWTFAECEAAFGYTLEDFLYFGGYPGAASLRGDKHRWFEYMNSAIIEATLSRDVIALEPIRKPAVLRALFKCGAQYSAQEVSYRKLLGQLDDAGNTNTIAHYLELLKNAGLLAGIKKYSAKLLQTRSSSPRLMVFDTSLMTATSGSKSNQLLSDSEKRGHLIESAVGAYLLARSSQDHFDVFWWREGDHEVDFVVERGEERFGIEVKSGRMKNRKGLTDFVVRYPRTRALVIGSPEAPLESFLKGEIALF